MKEETVASLKIVVEEGEKLRGDYITFALCALVRKKEIAIEMILGRI